MVDTTRKPRHRAGRAMPAFVDDALRQRGLVEAYDARPPHQRDDYLIWIVGARLQATRLKRLQQMRTGGRLLNDR